MGTGIDIVKTERFQTLIEKWGKKFLERVFTPGEIDYCSGHKRKLEHFAARFAAKEALVKCLGTGLRDMKWKEVEVVNNQQGKPLLKLYGNAARIACQQQIQKFHLSLSHEKEYAIAQVIGEGGILTSDCSRSTADERNG